MTALKIADLQRVAREEGAYQTKLETARAMISIGLPEDQIQLCTGLPLETIRGLVRREQ